MSWNFGSFFAMWMPQKCACGPVIGPAAWSFLAAAWSSADNGNAVPMAASDPNSSRRSIVFSRGLESGRMGDTRPYTGPPRGIRHRIGKDLFRLKILGKRLGVEVLAGGELRQPLPVERAAGG